MKLSQASFFITALIRARDLLLKEILKRLQQQGLLLSLQDQVEPRVLHPVPKRALNPPEQVQARKPVKQLRDSRMEAGQAPELEKLQPGLQVQGPALQASQMLQKAAGKLPERSPLQLPVNPQRLSLQMIPYLLWTKAIDIKAITKN